MSKRFKRIGLPFMVGILSLGLAFPSVSNAKKEDPVPIKLVTEQGNEIGFGIPKSKQDKKVKKELKNNSKKVNKDRIEQTITIEPTENPTIEVPLELPEGHYLVLLNEGEQGIDGAAVIYNEDNESVALFSTPVAEDGEELEVVNAEIIEESKIQFELYSGDFVEPKNLLVSLSSTSYSSYFEMGAWILRDSDYPRSLSLYHKPYLFEGSTNDRIFKLGDSWNKVVDRHNLSPYWSNETGLRDQYYCHFNTIAAAKNPWNIEPARPNVGYTATVLAGCNPK